MFNVEPAPHSPDLELLLLDTVRHAPGNARLLIMAVTWLSRYGALIDILRLHRLIREELDTDHRPTMGLMLELAVDAGAPVELREAVAVCEPAVDPAPLFDVYRRTPALREFAEKNASATSRRWSRWAQPFELKTDAIRPASWVMHHNPQFARRVSYRDGG
ncbi:MAG: hypothetical protein GC159_16335 [Phycisphaera sp.]|nr:hypothetical protein [Phycisphaera sp.]